MNRSTTPSERPFTVASWNVAFAGVRRAKEQASFLSLVKPDLVFLQEVNAVSVEVYSSIGALDWLICSRGLPPNDVERKRRPAAAIGGSSRVRLIQVEPPLMTAILEERICRAVVQLGDSPVAVASYYAPPGVSHGYDKVLNALAFADWLRELVTPAIFGADANTPKVDHPDFERTLTHWHTGHLQGGRRGDDELWGPRTVHGLRDALRVWLDDHPLEFEEVRRTFPDGPLATSYWTGRRRLVSGSGKRRRYDSIWISSQFGVSDVTYREDCMPHYSDHAMVVADITLRPPTGGYHVAGKSR